MSVYLKENSESELYLSRETLNAKSRLCFDLKIILIVS